MEVLTLGGVRYVKASKAAKDLGYATDYVGQLCRTGKVDSHLVGRTWYVNPDVLGAHRVEKKRNARIKAREYAKKSIAESLTVKSESKNAYRNIAIRYEGDKQELMPEVKKMHVTSEKMFVESDEDHSVDENFVYENKDKKILMAGVIPVYDAEEETLVTDVTILTPKIVKRTAQREVSESLKAMDAPHATDTPTAPEETLVAEPTPEPITFTERLASLDVVEEKPTEGSHNTPREDSVMHSSTAPVFTIISSIILGITVFVATLSVLALFVELELAYSGGNITEKLRFDSTEFQFLFEKI